MRASRFVIAAGVLSLSVASAGCSGCRKSAPGRAQGGLAALSSQPQTTIPVPGFLDAVVSVPVGATRPMPVVVAVLGIGDTPEEQCEAWRDIVDTRAFVLCPRGAKHFIQEGDEGGSAEPSPVAAKQAPPAASAAPSAEGEGETPAAPEEQPKPAPAPAPKPKAEARQLGFYPIDVATLDREVAAGLAALKQRFKIHVDEEHLVYAGFSRGAFLGASLVAKHPAKFGRAILIEGGQSAWTPESAAAFAKSGGKRVLFACGQPSCLDEVEPPSQLLRSQRVETKVVNGAGEGHGYKKQVKSELKKSFDWVVEGDPAWAD